MLLNNNIVFNRVNFKYTEFNSKRIMLYYLHCTFSNIPPESLLLWTLTVHYVIKILIIFMKYKKQINST